MADHYKSLIYLRFTTTVQTMARIRLNVFSNERLASTTCMLKSISHELLSKMGRLFEAISSVSASVPISFFVINSATVTNLTNRSRKISNFAYFIATEFRITSNQLGLFSYGMLAFDIYSPIKGLAQQKSHFPTS